MMPCARRGEIRSWLTPSGANKAIDAIAAWQCRSAAAVDSDSAEIQAAPWQAALESADQYLLLAASISRCVQHAGLVLACHDPGAVPRSLP
jgi:hypothetical protein